MIFDKPEKELYSNKVRDKREDKAYRQTTQQINLKAARVFQQIQPCGGKHSGHSKKKGKFRNRFSF